MAGLLVVVASTGSRRPRSAASFRSDGGEVQRSATGDIRLVTAGASFEIVGRPTGTEQMGSLRRVRDARGVVLVNVSLGAMVDSSPVRMVVNQPRTTPGGRFHAVARAELHADTAVLEAEVGYKMHRSPAHLELSLALRSAETRTVQWVLNVPVQRARAFVPGTGFLADLGEAHGTTLVLESAGAAAVLGAVAGPSVVHLAVPELPVLAPLTATVTGPVTPAGRTASAFVVTGDDGTQVAEAAARIRNERVRRLRGRVLGGNSDVDVWGVGSDGRAVLHTHPGPGGRFEVVAPMADLGFYATMAHTRASPMVMRAATNDSELELTMLPGGQARVDVVDFDTGEPLTARVIVHGVAPTADPNFGPDYRASGAGPLIDALRGQATMPLPSGRYRVLATRGPEYTIDQRALDITPGATPALRLALRKVIASTGWVAADMHVHARPSFDSPVLPEDRVLSLVAAGVDFAVPSEHNAVGNYDPSLEALGLGHQLATVPGVEVTTARPDWGHFNVFPYAGPNVPPFRHTTLAKIFAKAREGDPSRVLQVNHPRLGGGIGYFDIVGLDARTGRADREWRDDFDTLEVYNGSEASNRAKTEAVLMDWLHLLERGHRYVATGDSDSHRIQYQWAGYPRTYVALPRERAGDTGAPVDAVALIAALKAGHAFVTSGPFLEATIDGQGPGATVGVHGATARVHVEVRAAPWIDVTQVEVMLGSTSVTRVAVPARRCVTGPPAGDLRDARDEALRFAGDFDVPYDGGPGRFVVVVVRGTRAMDDVLPYMPIQPLAFTNPIWLERAR